MTKHAPSALAQRDANEAPPATAQASSVGPAGWKGTARFAVLRRIGEGGMGTVYEAFDCDRERSVAVKVLTDFDPAALYRFKQEFRTLADVIHPNLVRLHELVVADGQEPFFAMELVDGVDFRAYVRQKSGAPSSSPPAQRDEPTRAFGRAGAVGTGADSARSLRRSPADFGKLREALRQLVLGTAALHSAGKLHRDIKPSNVLVTSGGRVVVLDFGVATEWSRVQIETSDEVVGTASYMSPEQALAEQLSPASDWYSVGVVLYEALTGTLPFRGSSASVLAMKAVGDPVPPSERASDLPADLDALCRDLLSRDPEKRPDAREILRRLGGNEPPAAQSDRPTPDVGKKAALIGREEQLRALRQAFDHVVAGHSLTVRIHGASGMGKSAVAARFLDDLVESGEAVVLRGRAYEREYVPYKAVDSVVDALTRHLIQLEERGEPVPLPAHVASLARIFPVLRRVPRIASIEEGTASEPQILRRDAFSALRELLGALSKQGPLVLFVDDVQWGDTDSAGLLLDVTRPPDAPALLLVMAHRDGEAQGAPFLEELTRRWPGEGEMREVGVGPLDIESARSLARHWLDESDPMTERRARAAARESNGSPFLVEELARSNLAAGPEGDTLAVLTLEEIVRQRLARLPAHARRVVEVVALGARPLPVPVVARAAETPDAEDAIALLRSRRLVRAGMRYGKEVVETTHDRFRQTIVAQIPGAEVRDLNVRLATALEASGGADPEALAMQWLGAGDLARAKHQMERAAEHAFDKLALEQAARLFRLAIETGEATPEETRRLRARLAKVLALSGQGEAAARVFLEAAEAAPPLERAEFERSAAVELFASGRLLEGEAVLHRVLTAVGLRAPRSTLSAVFWLLLYRLRIAIAYLFGLPFEARETDQVPRLTHARIDAASAAAIGFAFSNVVLGTCMSARHLLMALRAGDRFQVLRAAIVEATQRAAMGGTPGGLERRLLSIARHLSERMREQGDPRSEAGAQADAAQAFLGGSVGVGVYLRGYWREALDLLDKAASHRSIHDHTAGWREDAHVFASWSLNFLGEHRELTRRHAHHLADAHARGDRYTAVQLCDGSLAIVWLARDDPEGARRSAHEAMALWPKDRYLLQHWHLLYGEVETELYVGEGAKAYARVKQDERLLRRSFLLAVQHMRVQTAFLRGRAAIASIQDEPSACKERVAEARRIAHRLARERAGWSAPFVSILRAAAADAEGDRSGAIAGLREAIDRAVAADMHGYARAARYQLGRALGGDEGEALMGEAVQAMTAQGIRAPARIAATLVPGRWVQRLPGPLSLPEKA